MKDKKINCLIIGGGGFIGSWLAKNLIEKGHKVTVLDAQFNYFQMDPEKFKLINFFRAKYLLKNARIIKGRFQDIGIDVIDNNNFQVIINLAAHAYEKPIDSFISNNQITNDIEITYKLVSIIKKQNKQIKFVYLSSSAVYGEYGYAAPENLPVNPKSIYGISKATCEFLIKVNLTNWNIVRSNAVYGFGDIGDRATHVLVEKAFNQQKAWVNDTVWCDFIYVKDLVEGIAQVIMKAPQGEIFNISGGEPYKLIRYVEEINRYLPFSFELKSVQDRPKRGVLNNSKAKMLLNWYPQYDLKSGIKDFMHYINKYKYL